MPRRSTFDFASLIVILILIVAGFFGGKFYAEYRTASSADRHCLEKIRQNGEVVLSTSVMERLLVIEDTEATYSKIKLILGVPVQVSYTTDLALIGMQETDNGLLMKLPEVELSEMDYQIDEAEIIDMYTGYGIPVPRGDFQEMYAFFEQAVETDRNILLRELEDTDYADDAELSLRQLILSLTRGMEFQYEE